MTIVADHLDNAGSNAIVKSSLLKSMYIINQRKTLLQMYVTAVMLPFSLYRFILPYFGMVVRYSYVCDDCISSIVLFDFIFVKRPRMLPVQFVRQNKTFKNFT